MNQQQKRELDEWLADKPDIIRRLAYKFPPVTSFLIDATLCFLTCYNDDGSIIVSEIDPHENFATANTPGPHQHRICADCLATLDVRKFDA